jgi:hypothetical protein
MHLLATLNPSKSSAPFRRAVSSIRLGLAESFDRPCAIETDPMSGVGFALAQSNRREVIMAIAVSNLAPFAERERPMTLRSGAGKDVLQKGTWVAFKVKAA